jgi:hypothetical protein
MSHNPQIFAFETDFAGALYCIPMVVRRKLDQCGVKVSLKQWNRFALDEREQLVAQGCDSSEDVEAYRRCVVSLIEARTQDAAQFVDKDAGLEWNDATQVPARMIAYADNLGVRPPSVAQWAALTPLQRFALFKLTRPGHSNDNFIPAMREFGLIE